MTKITKAGELTDEAMEGVSGGRLEAPVTDTTATAIHMQKFPIPKPEGPPHFPKVPGGKL